MHSIRLTYFDLHGGRGEVARLAMFIGGIDFEDRRVKFDDWPALKPKTPFGGIPVLEVDGEPVAQSNGINRFLGKLADLLPLRILARRAQSHAALASNCLMLAVRVAKTVAVSAVGCRLPTDYSAAPPSPRVASCTFGCGGAALGSTGTCFDIGGTVASALRRFRQSGEPFAGSSDPGSAGNGCIMRLAPIPMFFFPNLDAAERFGAESSRTTHGAAECLDACRLLARIICRALLGSDKDEVALGDSGSFVGAKKIVAIARGTYRGKSEADVRGSGYVVENLEAATWCFLRTDTFEDAILMAANLGDDADTTAAVCGQIAGAYYGASKIPAAWVDRLASRWLITNLAERLCRGGIPVSE